MEGQMDFSDIFSTALFIVVALLVLGVGVYAMSPEKKS
jgi:hypothetical protein